MTESEEGHQIWTIGWNTFGQQVMGSDDIVDKLTRIDKISSNITIRDIQTGFNGSTYVLLRDNKMIVMGNNEDGQLGLDLNSIAIIINYWLHILELDLFINTDVLNVINDFTHLNYEHPKVSTPILITHFNIKSISHGIGSHHRFIITENNRIYGCGENTHSQLGKVNASNKLATWRQIRSFVECKINIQSIATSNNVTNFLSNDGDIYVIGRSIDGGLGLGRNTQSIAVVTRLEMDTKFISIACGHDHSIAVDITYRTFSWGFNMYHQTGHPTDKFNRAQFEPKEIQYFMDKQVNIKMVDCGRYHSVWLDFEGNIYCAGSNNRGQCGGRMHHPADITKNEILGGHIFVIHIKCGRNHNCVKTKNGHYYLFGDNLNNECLVNPNADYIALPTQYDVTYFHQQKKDVVAIYPGFYETRIVTKNMR